MEDVFIGQVSAGLGERHDATPHVLKAPQGYLASDRLAHKVAAALARPLAEPVEHTFEISVETNRQGALHVLQCNTLDMNRRAAVENEIISRCHSSVRIRKPPIARQ